MNEPGGGGKSPLAGDARLRQQAIGVKLRQMFDDIVSEPVPDEFLDILRRHDSKNADESHSGDSKSGGES